MDDLTFDFEAQLQQGYQVRSLRAVRGLGQLVACCGRRSCIRVQLGQRAASSERKFCRPLSLLIHPPFLVLPPPRTGRRVWRRRRPQRRRADSHRRRPAQAAQLPAHRVHLLAARAVHEGGHLRLPAPVRSRAHARLPRAAQARRVQGARWGHRRGETVACVWRLEGVGCDGERFDGERFGKRDQPVVHLNPASRSYVHLGMNRALLRLRCCARPRHVLDVPHTQTCYASTPPPPPPADCPYKHSMDAIKECNMYKLGFCIYGPAVSALRGTAQGAACAVQYRVGRGFSLLPARA